jgi:hypothetical protein
MISMLPRLFLFAPNNSQKTKNQTMRKLTVLLSAMMAAVLAFGWVLTGCSSAPADGKLQIMYSGNIRGNVAPCG